MGMIHDPRRLRPPLDQQPTRAQGPRNLVKNRSVWMSPASCLNDATTCTRLADKVERLPRDPAPGLKTGFKLLEPRWPVAALPPCASVPPRQFLGI